MNSVGSGAMNTSNIAGNELTQFSLGNNGSMPCWKIPKQTCLSLDCTERTRHLCISVEAASKKCKKRSYWRKPWISRHEKQGAYNNLAAELEAGGSCVTTRITKSQFGDIIGTFTPLIKPILTNTNFQAVIDHNIVSYFHRRWPTSGRSRRQVLFVPIVAHHSRPRWWGCSGCGCRPQGWRRRANYHREPTKSSNTCFRHRRNCGE